MFDSAWQQASHLASHLEWDLRANHLLRDAIGLLWAGRLFDHPTAEAWLRQGTRLAVEQAGEQVLDDGCHFERSPMYQIHVFEDLLSAMLLVRDPAAERRLRWACERLAEAMAWIRHPDGGIPLLNDAALSSVSSPTEALDLASAHGIDVDPSTRSGTRHFADAGLLVHHGPRWSLFFDVGPVGPDEQPGHAHADTFTLSASLDGVRLLIDPGTYGYDHDEARSHDRSTAAHNTVAVDGLDSSEVWHIFRVGRRARVHDVVLSTDHRGVRCSAWHDGYAHLEGAPIHTRELELTGDVLQITDRVSGTGAHRLAGGLLFETEWSVEKREGRWVAKHATANKTVHIESSLPCEKTIATYHPQYGVEQPAVRLGWTVDGQIPREIRLRLRAV